MDHMENEVVVDEKKSQMRTTTSSDSGVWKKNEHIKEMLHFLLNTLIVM